MLEHQKHRSAPLPADGEALDEPEQYQQDGRQGAHVVVGRQ
jgi:hypothetical protein